MTPADHCHQMRLRVGDTIEGREEWPTGWHDARLTRALADLRRPM